MSPSYLSPLKSTPLSRRDTDYSKDASPISQEEEELYECDLSSFAHQFNFTRTKAESLTLDEFLGVPANRNSKTDSLLGGLLPQGSLSDLSDLLAELDNIEANAPQASARRLSMLLLPEDNEDLTSDSPTQAVPLTELEKKIEIAKKRLENANLKKLTTTIYLFDAQNPQTVQITSLSTPETIIQSFLDNGKLQSQNQWVITEIHEAFGVERIMKPWEPILDVIDAWEAECHSALLIRVRQNESTTPEVPRDAPLMAGTLQIEVRRGKWEKRFVVLKRGGIYLAKNENSIASATLLCSMQNFDAFTLNRPRVKSPKKPQFALKSQQPIALFEKPEDDYIHFFACSSPAERDTWMRALRYSRSWVHYEMFLSRPATAALFSPFVDEGILTDHLIGIELDQGQYAELEAGVKANGGSSTLTRNTPGAIAGRLFRLVLTGDQGKTDIDRVVGSKALPNVFSEGSLLSKPHAPKPTAPTEEAEPVAEDGEVFKEGSLLSRKLSIKKVPGSGPLLDYQPQSGSLLDSIESSQKGAKVKPQPLTILGGKGGASTLLQLKSKDSGLFQTGTLLSKNASSTHSGSNKPPISLSQWTGPTGNSSGGTASAGAGSSPATLFSAGSSSLPGGRQGTLGGALCESPTSPLAPTLPGSRDPRTRDSPPEPTPAEVTAAEKSPTSNRVSNVISQQQQIRKQKSQRVIPARNHINQGPGSSMRDPTPLRSYKSGPLLVNVHNDGKSPISRHHSSRATPGNALKPPSRQPAQMHPLPPNFQPPHYHPGIPRPAGPPPHGHFQYPTHPHPHSHPHPAPHQRKHQSTHPGMAPLLPPMAPPPHALPRNSVAPPPHPKAGPLLHLAPPAMPNMPNMMHHPHHPHSTKKPPMKPLLSFK